MPAALNIRGKQKKKYWKSLVSFIFRLLIDMLVEAKIKNNVALNTFHRTLFRVVRVSNEDVTSKGDVYMRKKYRYKFHHYFRNLMY